MNQSNRRRLYVFLGTLAVALAASLGYTWLRPAEYRTSARLEITPAAATLPLGPAATSTAESPRPFLTETQVLTSRPVLELAATRLDRVGQPYLSVGPDRVSDMQIARGGGAGSKHERRRADCHGPASRGARADA